jgi:MFS family permease
MLLVPFLSEYPPKDTPAVRARGKQSWIYIGLALLAIFLFQAANMGVYAYAIGIGKNALLDSGFINASLGLAAWVAIAGSVLVIVLSTRYGRLIPVSIALVLTVGGIGALHFSNLNPNSWATSVYWWSNVLVGITWAFTISYLLGMCSEFDSSGQMAALGGFASKMGLASGPAVAAVIVGTDDYSRVINVAVIALILCIAVFFVPARMLDRRSG